MPVTTKHQFLDIYPVKNTDKRMIIGTIHPHLIENFFIAFYYGNVGSFWNILGTAFPHHDFSTKLSILEILNKYQTWITDIIRECDREDENVTRDDLLFNIVDNSQQIEDALNESQIDTIYLTSRFGKNNAANLFTTALKINYSQTLNRGISEFTIPANRFGRLIRCLVLYSPSGFANKGIVRSLPYKNNINHYSKFPGAIQIVARQLTLSRRLFA